MKINNRIITKYYNKSFYRYWLKIFCEDLNEYHKLTKEYKKVYEREPKDDKSYGWK